MRRSLAPKLWKVLIHRRASGTRASTRWRISPAALLVKVMARMFDGRTPRRNNQATRRVMTRVLTQGEIRYCRARRKSNEHFAARFAAKEAVLKCLGTGMAKELSWIEIEVCNEARGQPSIKVHGATRELAQSKRVSEFLI